MRPRTRRLVSAGCLGILLLGWLAWAIVHTEAPPLPVLVADLVAVIGLAVGPWLLLAGWQLRPDPVAGRVFWRALRGGTLIVLAGVTVAVVLAVTSPSGDRTEAAVVAIGSVLAGTVLTLVGGIAFPWLFLLTRAVARERAARVRAEERADVAAHLHDSVLQALIQIQKQADNPAVLRLARGTERELRTWLYGGPATRAGDFAGAVRAVTEEVEDRFAVNVELVEVGTGPLDARTSAVLGAIREAVTNAAKHAGVRRVSVFAEVSDAGVLALIKDRGCGFDPTARNGDRRGIADSIEARMQQHGGTAEIRSAPGEGTEVELRMPAHGPTKGVA